MKVLKTSRLMLYREIVAVCFGDHARRIKAIPEES
jgi:hypothetical protein